MPRTIVAKGRGIRKELNAGGAVNPGHIVMINGSGLGVVQSGAAATSVALLVAVENELFGKGVEDAYATGDRLLLEHLYPGQEAYFRVAPSNPAVALGTFLETQTGGRVKAVTTGKPILQALEAVDNSGNAASEAFILCQVV